MFAQIGRFGTKSFLCWSKDGNKRKKGWVKSIYPAMKATLESGMSSIIIPTGKALQKTTSFGRSTLTSTKQFYTRNRPSSMKISSKERDEILQQNTLSSTETSQSLEESERDTILSNSNEENTQSTKAGSTSQKLLRGLKRSLTPQSKSKNEIGSDYIEMDPSNSQSFEDLKARLENLDLLIEENELTFFKKEVSDASGKHFVNHVLGSGGFGAVHLGTYKREPVAIKTYTIEHVDECFFREVSMMLLVHGCKNVIPLLGVCWEKRYIVTTFASTDLEVYKTSMLNGTRGTVPMNSLLSIMFEIAIGMREIHALNPIIIHRDLCLSNVVLNFPCKVFICDFGIAMQQYEGEQEAFRKYSRRGRRNLLAPEIRKHKPYNYKVDVYSYGLMLYNFLSAAPKKRPTELHWTQEFEKDIAQLISSCCSKQPEKRPSFRKICQKLEQIIQKRSS